MNRKDLGKEALMVIETDQKVTDDVMEELTNAQNIIHVCKK